VASRLLFYCLNGTLAGQLGYDNVVWPQLNRWEIEQPHSLKYFTFGSLSGENITSFVFQDYQLLPYLGNIIPLVAHVGHTSLNLCLSSAATTSIICFTLAIATWALLNTFKIIPFQVANHWITLEMDSVNYLSCLTIFYEPFFGRYCPICLETLLNT